MSRYPGPPSVPPGQSLPTVGGYQAPGMPGHMPSPQTVPPYNVGVASPSQYGQQQGPGPSPTPPHYPHPSVTPILVFFTRQPEQVALFLASTNNDDSAGRLRATDNARNNAVSSGDATSTTSGPATSSAASSTTARSTGRSRCQSETGLH